MTDTQPNAFAQSLATKASEFGDIDFPAYTATVDEFASADDSANWGYERVGDGARLLAAFRALHSVVPDSGTK